MIISLIVAMDEKRGIGVSNRLPWHLASDLKRFKMLTMGHYLVMGRKTYETIGRPLTGRIMIVVSRQRDFHPVDCIAVNSLEEALKIAEENGEKEVFIIGGGELFIQALDIAQRIYLTSVHANVKADVFFPRFDQNLWKIISSEKSSMGREDDYDSDFKILSRVQ